MAASREPACRKKGLGSGGVFYTCTGLRGQRYILLGAEKEQPDNRLVLCIFMGSRNEGETFAQAAARETAEESLEVIEKQADVLAKIESGEYKALGAHEKMMGMFWANLGTPLSRAARIAIVQRFAEKRKQPSLKRGQKEMHEIQWVPLQDLFVHNPDRLPLRKPFKERLVLALGHPEFARFCEPHMK